jgi:hypothetical protein
LKTHHETSDTTDAKKTTNVIDALQDMGGGILRGKARRIMIAENAEKQADEVPDTDKNAVIAPIARFCNELGVQHRWAKGKNGQNDKTNVLATILDWNDFCCSSESDKFVETGAYSRKHIASC